jgi:hypothetical protein
MTEQGESQSMKDTPEELFKEKNNDKPEYTNESNSKMIGVPISDKVNPASIE